VLIGDHESNPAQAALAQALEEPAPEHLVLAVPDIEAEDLAFTGGGDPGGDDHGHRGDLGGLVADVEIGGVQVDVGELDVVQAAGSERVDHLIQAGADAGHLGLLDPRVRTQGADEVVNGAGGDPVDVGLHHHRVQRLIDPPPRLQDGREEAALAQLGNAQLYVAGLGG
jgi:hypothetical protein